MLLEKVVDDPMGVSLDLPVKEVVVPDFLGKPVSVIGVAVPNECSSGQGCPLVDLDCPRAPTRPLPTSAAR